ncbi:secretion protein HlyD [Pseudomonas sp. G5(2012)]|nr:secretion protein HlyD [Pseudomonas sp. G5(2012)]
MLAFDERDVAVIQSRTAGFVERVYARAPGDVLKARAALADILVPEWAAAQDEFLALKRSGDADLLAAARQRLRLTGMPATLIAQVERSGKTEPGPDAHQPHKRFATRVECTFGHQALCSHRTLLCLIQACCQSLQGQYLGCRIDFKQSLL